MTTSNEPLFTQPTITIDTDNLETLFRARYFLAGILIGAVILLPVFLVTG